MRCRPLLPHGIDMNDAHNRLTALHECERTLSVHTHKHTYTHTCTYMDACICRSTCIHVHVHVHKNTYTQTYARTHTHISLYVCIVRIRTHVHVHVHVHVYAHVHVRINKHACRFARWSVLDTKMCKLLKMYQRKMRATVAEYQTLGLHCLTKSSRSQCPWCGQQTIGCQ